MTWWRRPKLADRLEMELDRVSDLWADLNLLEARLDAAIEKMKRGDARTSRIEAKAQKHASGLLQLQATVMAQGSTLDAISDRVDALAKLDARADLAAKIEAEEARND
jgi:hypothetical protein